MVFRDDAVPRRDTDAIEVTRSEEQLLVHFDRVPYRRVRLVKYVTTEEVTRTFQVRREQLRVEPEDVNGVPAIEPWAARLTVDEPLELTLSDEQVVLETKIVPRERIRVWVEDVPMGEETITGTLGKEKIEVIDPSRADRGIPEQMVGRDGTLSDATMVDEQPLGDPGRMGGQRVADPAWSGLPTAGEPVDPGRDAISDPRDRPAY